MVYASAYIYRATIWFDFVMHSPSDRKWLRQEYPKYWDNMDAVRERIGERRRGISPGADEESSVLGTLLPTFLGSPPGASQRTPTIQL